MVEVESVHYLNPLTLEAQLFLNSLETLGKSCNQIDLNLCETLENVVLAIEKFLDQQPSQIVSSEKTELIATPELAAIQRIYHCVQCKVDLGKSADKAAAHLADKHKLSSRAQLHKMRKRVEKQERRNNILLKLPKKTKSLIACELPKFFNDNLQIAEKLKQIPEYDTIETDLLSIITPLFPEDPIKLYKFGSRITGIGTRNSDLDIFVDIGNSFNTFENRPTVNTLQNLGLVRDALRKHGKSWTHLVAIENARVPIIKVCHARTSIECDIGFSNSLGFCNTKLMEYLYELQPITRRMCLFLKKWLDRSKLSDNISTYSISLMVIYFLQLNEHLPGIDQLQMNLSDTGHVGPWIANFLEKRLDELNIAKVDISPQQCENLLKRFFEFYAEFNFAVYAICPYFGRQMEKKHIEAQMPERYSNYVHANVATKDCGLELRKCLVVQDPIQLNHNVTKGVTPFILKHFTDYFKQSAEAFTELK